MQKIDFSNRVAVVTGSGTGLGRCYAIELAKRGAKVVVNDTGGAKDGMGSSTAVADKVVEEIKALGGEAVANYDNIADVAGGENLLNTALKAFGKVDILINNAGILRDKTILKMDEKDWDSVIAVHLKGAYCVTKPIFGHMKANNYGRIIMTTSGAGLFGNFGQANYSAAKMGLVGFVNTLKIEGEKYNIKLNLIAPAAATRLSEGVVIAKMSVELVAPAVLYLVSEQCQDSGMIINAAGGSFSRSAVVTAQSVQADNPTPEFIAENWQKITSLENGKTFNSLNEFGADFMI